MINNSQKWKQNNSFEWNQNHSRDQNSFSFETFTIRQTTSKQHKLSFLLKENLRITNTLLKTEQVIFKQHLHCNNSYTISSTNRQCSLTWKFKYYAYSVPLLSCVYLNLIKIFSFTIFEGPRLHEAKARRAGNDNNQIRKMGITCMPAFRKKGAAPWNPKHC